MDKRRWFEKIPPMSASIWDEDLDPFAEVENKRVERYCMQMDLLDQINAKIEKAKDDRQEVGLHRMKTARKVADPMLGIEMTLRLGHIKFLEQKGYSLVSIGNITEIPVQQIKMLMRVIGDGSYYRNAKPISPFKDDINANV